MVDLSKMFQEISDKVGMPIDDVKSEYDQILANTKKKITVDKDAEKTSVLRLRSKYRSQLRTNAAWWDGVIIGYSDPNYYLLRLFIANKQMYKDDPEGAIKDGYANDEGEPLDSRVVLSSGKDNATYGTPLKELDYQNKCIMTVYGVARKKDTEELKPFKLSLFDEQTKIALPMLQYVKFRANDRTPDDPLSNIYQMSYSTTTKFQVQPEFPEELKLEKLLSKFDAVELEDLEVWHDQHESDYDAIVVTRGMVGQINLDTGKDDNGKEKPYTMTLDPLDDSDEIADEQGEVPDALFLQVPKYVNIDFAEGSIIYVIGRTWRGWNNKENKPGNVSLTAYNLYVPEEYKVDIEPATPPAGSIPTPEPQQQAEAKQNEFF